MLCPKCKTSHLQSSDDAQMGNLRCPSCSRYFRYGEKGKVLPTTISVLGTKERRDPGDPPETCTYCGKRNTKDMQRHLDTSEKCRRIRALKNSTVRIRSP
jgi:hypothetical protein